jgi:D-xylose transport system substrate-binding protein
VNSTTKDTEINADIKSVYTTPIWVTPDNMNDTVVKDGAVKVSDLCSGNVADACAQAGIQ